MAGYSKRLLPEKLGIKPGYAISIVNPPENYPPDLRTTSRGELDLLQFFTTSRAELEKQFPKLKAKMKQNGALWISWPKGASKVKTDLNENVVRDIGVANGMVDVKVIAVDDVWSGLKFVIRLKDRK